MRFYRNNGGPQSHPSLQRLRFRVKGLGIRFAVEFALSLTDKVLCFECPQSLRRQHQQVVVGAGQCNKRVDSTGWGALWGSLWGLLRRPTAALRSLPRQ